MRRLIWVCIAVTVCVGLASAGGPIRQRIAERRAARQSSPVYYCQPVGPVVIYQTGPVYHCPCPQPVPSYPEPAQAGPVYHAQPVGPVVVDYPVARPAPCPGGRCPNPR